MHLYRTLFLRFIMCKFVSFPRSYLLNMFQETTL